MMPRSETTTELQYRPSWIPRPRLEIPLCVASGDDVVSTRRSSLFARRVYDTRGRGSGFTLNVCVYCLPFTVRRAVNAPLSIAVPLASFLRIADEGLNGDAEPANESEEAVDFHAATVFGPPDRGQAHTRFAGELAPREPAGGSLSVDGRE